MRSFLGSGYFIQVVWDTIFGIGLTHSFELRQPYPYHACLPLSSLIPGLNHLLVHFLRVLTRSVVPLFIAQMFEVGRAHDTCGDTPRGTKTLR